MRLVLAGRREVLREERDWHGIIKGESFGCDWWCGSEILIDRLLPNLSGEGASMHLPRLTIRRLMLAVVALAIVLRLIIVARIVFWQPNAQTLTHLRLIREDNVPMVHNHATTASQYWSEYWRRVIGVRWPIGFTCSCKAEFESETGKSTIDIDTSHDMDEMDRRAEKL
jgi:hypothetical protein